jgi:hypothetical protein
LPQKSSLAANWVPQKTAARFAVFRSSSLFLTIIEIAWYFADLRTASNSLARPQDMGPARPSCFCRESTGINYSVAITARRSRYVVLLSVIPAKRRNSRRVMPAQITTIIRNCQLENGSQLRGLPRGVDVSEYAAVVRDRGGDGIGRARVRRKWQVSGPDPFRTYGPHALRSQNRPNMRREPARVARHTLLDVVARALTGADQLSSCLKVASSGPRPAQHPASLPSITTAGRLRTPCCFARAATCACCML